jgi:Lrp/AsnC family transcriptional regulator for asnA, asnC and gidA
MDFMADIDEIDNKILHMLIQDSRKSLKEMAMECRVSPVSILNRVKRLKRKGIITGAALFASLDIFGFEIVASIGIEVEAKADAQKITKFLREHTFLVEPSASIGKYDFHALIYAKNITHLNECIDMIRRLRGVLKVTAYVWSGFPHLNYDNINLMQAER